jgi:hypothetical protein
MLIQFTIVAGCCREKPAFHFIEHAGNQHVSILMVCRNILIADDALRHTPSCVQITGAGTPRTAATVSPFPGYFANVFSAAKTQFFFSQPPPLQLLNI